MRDNYFSSKDVLHFIRIFASSRGNGFLKQSESNRSISLLLGVILIFFVSVISNAQVATNGGSGLNATYPDLATAITVLNGATITSPVVITLTGNETAPAGGYVITAEGTSVNTITIEGVGSTITASSVLTSGALNDAIFKLVGADFVTLRGFTMLENTANTTTTAASNNMTEWGVALLYTSVANGCQNVTIQNNTIDLTRTYQNSFGIYSNSTHSATAPTTAASATGATGGNHNTKIYGNTITDVNNGIAVVGPIAAADINDGLDIGGTDASTANTITNFGSNGTFSAYQNIATSVATGIAVKNTKNINVSYNAITSSSGGTTSGTLRGIYVYNFNSTPVGTFTNSFNNNTISLLNGSAAGGVVAIASEVTTSTSTSTLNVNNNDITNCGHSLTPATTVPTAGIAIISVGATALNTNINDNKFTNLTIGTTGTLYFIYNDGVKPANSVVNVNNNKIVGSFTKTNLSGTVIFYTSAGTTTPTSAVENNLNNNFSNVTVSGSTIISGWISKAGAATSPYGATKTVTGNIFNNITADTGAVTLLSVANSNNATDNSVSGNTISNFTGNTGAFVGVTIASGNQSVSGNTISNINTTSGTIKGITTAAGTNRVFGNTLKAFKATGLPTVFGIEVTGGAHSIYKNKIHNFEGGTGTVSANTITGIAVTAGTQQDIYNNIIGDLRSSLNGTNSIVGMNIAGTTTANLYNNTVVLNAVAPVVTDFGSAAVSVGQSVVLTMKNNILVNTSGFAGAGKTVAWRKSTDLANYASGSNNNLFYASTIFYDGTNFDTTLANYKARTTPRDGSSVSENPSFVSMLGTDPTYLHIDTATPTQIESAGTNIASVTDDFDGDARNATTPDIGADEFAGTAVDLTGPGIAVTPDTSCNVGSRTISATITDASGVPTSGVGLPIAYWRINSGAYTAVTGVSMGAGVYEFTIGTGSVAGDALSYYIVAQDVAGTPNVSVFPLAGSAGLTANPPAAATAPTVPNALLIPMGGVYTVGSGGNYATLTAAVADYNTRCLSGSVTFSLLDSSYSAGETFPITIQSNNYASAVNTLTIKPASGITATITGSNTSALLVLNGADYVSVNGLNSGGSALTISNTSTAATAGTIKFQADAINNTITNSSVLGSTTVTNAGGTSGVVFFGTGTTTGNDGNTISYCNIGPVGTNLPSKLIGSIGTSATVANSGNTITNCNLYDYFLTSGCSAVFVEAGNTDWTVTNNRIYQTGARTFTATGIFYGIAFNNTTSGDNVQITGNTIGYADNAGTGTLVLNGSVVGEFQGIYLGSSSTAATACNVNNNTVSNISIASSSGRVYGIYNGSSASSNTINVNGNSVRNIATTTTTNTVYPIYAGAATTLNCNNNTVDAISRTGAGILYGISYGAAANVTVNSNTITNLSSTSTSSTSSNNFAGIYGTTSSQIETVTNNTINGLTSSSTSTQVVYGINTGSSAANKTIQNNTLSNISLPSTATGGIYGIRMSAGGANNVISGNTVSAFSGVNSVTGINGINISAAGSFNTIYNNKVYGLSGAGASSTVYGFSITSGNTHNLYNNIIGDLTTPIATNNTTGAEPHLVVGINAYSYTTLNVYNNTIVLNGTNTGTNFGSSALYANGNLTLRNNILINNLPSNGTGISAALRLPSGVSNYGGASNNNLFKGNAIHTTNGTTGMDVTLDAFKTRVANRDVLSVTENPTFVSTVGSDPNYLHINTTVSTQIESGGAPIATVTNDFDGDVRNASTPDIGADEFAGVANDLVGPSIAHTPDTFCAAGSRTISATITDASGVPTSGAGSPVAYWRINSGAYTAAVGTSMGGGVYNFTIGTGSVTGDFISYYFVAQDVAATPNVSVYPSLGAAGFSVNPPAAATAATAPFKLVTPLAGVYTVGATGTYATLTAAVSDYNTKCLGGPVTFSLLDTTYSGETLPVTIQSNADASAVNTLTIKPASGVTTTITGSNASAILKLNGADYVTIDGSNNGTNSKDLTITNTNTGTSSAVIWIASTAATGATNNTFKNSVFRGQAVGTTRSVIMVSGSSITGNAEMANSGNKFQNNTISLAKNGIEILGPTALQAGTVISGNIFGTAANTLSVSGVSVKNETGTVIDGNTIQGVLSASTLPSPFTTVGGVVLSSPTTGVVISNNTIKDIKSVANLTGGNSVAGIVTTAGNTNTIINGNTITDIANTSTSGYGVRGMTILGSGTTVANNMISDIYNYQGSSAGSNSTIGITLGTDVANVSLHHNSIHLFGAHAGYSTNTTGIAACIFVTTVLNGLDIRNNILVNSYDNTTSSGDKSYAIYAMGTDNTQFTAINNNNYFVTGNSTPGTPVLGYMVSDRATLSDMASGFGGNANAVSVLPVFVSNTDLHLVPTSNSTLDNLGAPIATVTTDIDGQTRNVSTPDMGADEFTSVCGAAVGGNSVAATATLCTSGSTTISAAGYTVGNGITYQWESSLDMAFTTPVNEGVSSATYANLTTPTITATTYYRLKVTCSAGISGYSAVSTVTVASAAVAPTFTQVADICSGTALSALPTTSNNGIAGIWSPALNNAATTTYTFTPNAGQCASATTMTITVNTPTTPTFAQVAAICSGTALSALPTTSTNGITGTWSPALDNSATTTYTFTPNVGQCGTTTTMTITVNPATTPTFAQVAAICSGTALSALPTTSTNGIAGTWSPALDNSATTTYTFTPNVGQCGTTATMTITVNPATAPTFTQVAAICSGSTLSALPTTSNNGIAGTWSPALDNTATTTYTFTPNVGQCGVTTTMTITVNSTPAPTGTSPQTYTTGQTLANLSVAGSNVVWYASAADAASGSSPLPLSTPLVDGTVYYATQSVSGCVSSSSLAVQANFVLGQTDFALSNLKLYPNPVSDVLQIENPQAISSIEVYNIAGQKMMSKSVNAMTATISMSGFAAGTYFVKVATGDAVKTVKMIKK